MTNKLFACICLFMCHSVTGTNPLLLCLSQTVCVNHSLLRSAKGRSRASWAGRLWQGREGQGQGGGQGWGQAVAGHVSADDTAGADQEVGLPLGD